MKRKIVIVGGVAGGASAAAKLRRNSEEDQIIMFERGPHVSFSNCALPYHLSGIVEKAEDLVLMNPQIFYKQYNIEARVNSEVIQINRDKKEVTVRNLESGDEYAESYDKLILSPGASPIVPDIEGINKVNHFTIRNVVDVDKLNQFIKEMPSKNVVVIGGGFIGVEVAENLQKANYNVTLIQRENQILEIYDYDMVQILHKEMMDQGVNLIVGDPVAKFEKNVVILASGKRIRADAVVIVIGVKPETKLAKEAGLELGITGAIKTDKNYCTVDPDIYAVGDAIEVYNVLTHMQTKLSLAGPAQKQARTVAEHMNERSTRNNGYIGSTAIQVFEYNAASTGLNESMIQQHHMKIKYNIVRLILNDKVGLMPTASPMHLKLLFEVPTGKVLGAQAIGKGDVTKRIDVIASVIKFEGTVEDLKDLELCYAPTFSTAKDIVNYAGYIGSNLLNEEFRQVNIDKVRELVENGSLIIDVREPKEYSHGHIIDAINIPLSQLRDRVNEIPQNQPVYLHCRTGQRSYNAVMALQNLGYENVFNIAGSFMGISFYEFYDDQRLGRNKIVTDYNFR